MSVEIGGLEDTRRALRGAPREVKQAFRREMKTAIEPVRRRAAAEAPKRTGKLRRTIKSSAADRGAKIKAGTPSRVPYAGRVHWKKTKRKRRGDQFFTRAMRKEMKTTRELIGGAVRRTLGNIDSA